MQVRQVLGGAFAAAIAMVFFTASAEGVNWYVDASKTAGTGDGKSPETAFHTIQEAVEAASDGDTVSVAEGTYAEGRQPTRTHSYRSMTAYHNCRVYLKKKLNLIALGRKSETIILGEIGTEDATMRRDPTDTDRIGFATNNVSCIVVGKGAEGSLIKGFTLRNGWANHMAHDALAAGGVCHYKPSESNDFTVIDCDFDNCFGRGAGGVIGGTVIRCRFDACQANESRGVLSLARVYNCLVTNSGRDGKYEYDFYDCLVVNCTSVGNFNKYAIFKSDNCPEDMGVAYNTAVYWGESRIGYTNGKLVNCVVDGQWDAATSSDVVKIGTDTAARMNVCFNPSLGDYRPVKDGYLFCAEQKGDRQWMSLPFIPEGERFVDFNGNAIAATDEIPIGVLLPPVEASGVVQVYPEERVLIDGKALPASSSTLYYRTEKWPSQVTVRPEDPGFKFLGVTSPFTVYAGTHDEIVLTLPPRCMDDGSLYPAQTIRLLAYARELFVDVGAAFEGAPDGTREKPFRSIQAAVNAVTDATWTLIRVAEGTYEYDETCGKTDPTGLRAVVCVPAGRNVVIRADGAREKTIIRGAADTGAGNASGCGTNAIRCVHIAGTCGLAGMTIMNGHTMANDANLYQAQHLGGGVCATSATIGIQILDCVFTGNAGTTGVGYYGNYFRCIVTNNVHYARGLFHYCTLSSCLIANNGTKDYGKTYVTLYGYSSAYNCTIFEPTCYNCKVYNTNNALLNTVIQAAGGIPNSEGKGYRVVGCVVTTSATGEDKLTETPNQHVDPGLARASRGDYRPRRNSPCVGRGVARDPTPASETHRKNVENIVMYLGASIDYRKLVSSDGSVMVGAFADVAPMDIASGVFVSPTGDDGGLGYDAATAFRTLQAAVDFAKAEGETNVFALAGTYADGEAAAHTPRVFQGNDPKVGARVHVPAGVTLRAVDPDPSRTVIVGRSSTEEMPDNPFSSADLGHGFGDDALRCVFLENNAKVVGFTLTGGRTSYMKDGSNKYIDDTLGGAVLGRSVAACSVEDCILTGNRSPNGAGGSFVTFHRCVVTNNLVSNSYGSFTRHGAAYDCFVAGNYGQWPCDVISKGSEIVNCTFCDNWETTNRLYRARGVFNAESAAVRNCILCGVDAANVLRAVGEVSNCLVPSAVTAFDGVTNNVNNALTDAQIAALIDADGHPLAADANIVDAGAGRSVLEFDLAGTARVKNGAVDIGAYEYDWRPDYSKALARKGLTVTDVSASGVVETLADRKVTLTDGGAFAATLAGEVGMDYVLSATVTGSGALTVTQNGDVVGQITAATRSLTFSGASASDQLEFAYSGEGSATFDPLKRNIGMMLIVR